MFKWLSSIISSIISFLPFRRTRIINCDKMVVGMDEVRCLLMESSEILKGDLELLTSELRRKEAIINGMLENLPVMVWFKGVDGTYGYVNKSTIDNLNLPFNPIGLDDDTIVRMVNEMYGEGSMSTLACKVTDKEVIDNRYIDKNYINEVSIRNEKLYLDVKKSIVLLGDEVLGVAGSGTVKDTDRERGMTDERTKVR